MITVCLMGFGHMGRIHFDRYLALSRAGAPVRLVGILTADRQRVERALAERSEDARGVRAYENFDDMLDAERPDAVDIALPGHLHCPYALRALSRGLHVLCEKPMALSNEQTDEMMLAAKANDRALMVAHCCRFMASYRKLKDVAASGKLGKPRYAALYRMSGMPTWSAKNWLLNPDASGGCILDMHIHDVDILRWVFGSPQAVSALGIRSAPGSGIDGVSVQYRYPDFAANIQANWSARGVDVPFQSGYRVEFERGCLSARNGVTTLYEIDRPPVTEVDSETGDPYADEIRYFVERLATHQPIREPSAQDAALAVRLALIERKSVEAGGLWIDV